MRKKRKRRIFKRNKKRFIHLSLAACFIIGIVITVVFLAVIPKSSKKSQPPPYEEVSAKNTALSQAIGKIDQTIDGFLSDEKIPSQSIFLAAVEPRHEKKYNWDFSELGVNPEKKEDLPRLVKDFERALSKLKPHITYHKEIVSEKEIIYHIFVNELYTHKIRFVIADKQEVIINSLPKIAIVIDDLGYDPYILKELSQIDLPLTLSVLPSAPYEKEVIALAKSKGWDLLIHLPMEPKNYPDSNPGPNALFIRMSDEQVSEMVDKFLNELPEAKGVNNHMGSAFTENEDKMSAVMSEIKKRKLFYIDSRTTSQTVAFRVAKKMGVPTASRSVFLDNDLSPEAIQLQVERLLTIAKHSSQAVGIGHPHHETIDALKHYLSDLQDQIQIVNVSEIIH
jgi:hypothetical protein